MLLNYIPQFLNELNEFKKLFSALDIEISKTDVFLERLFDGQFIFYCDDEYIKLFEKLLGIESSEGDIDKRRKAIYLKFNEKLPYTVFRLKESLSIICGDKRYSIFLIYGEYRLILRVFGEDKDIILQCQKLLDRMIPANMKTEMVSFNTHEIVGNFKHSYLSKYTHSEIYREII